MAINDAGRQLIRNAEGRRFNAYTDSAGVWTIGYGHTGNVKSGDAITDSQAEAFLTSDLDKAEGDVLSLVTVALTENQKAALTSFVFNLGKGSLQGSTLLSLLNKGDYAGAAGEFGRWVKATNAKTGEKETLPGLVTRRAAEAALFRQA
jgi:lysozyme